MRKAFTLLELLAVIAIISLIIGILLPAVNAAREAARKIRCINNQRNLAVALLHYEETRGHFPGWRNYVKMADAQGEFTAQASWVFMILPQCEQQDLYDRIKSGAVTPGTPIPMVPILHCPSRRDGPGDPFFAPDPTAFGRSMNYIINGGAVDDFESKTPDGAGDPWTIDTNIANGPFLDMAAIEKEKLHAASRLADISRRDGTAYTLMLSENVQRGFWISSTLTDFCCTRRGVADPPDPPDNLTSGQDKIEGSVTFCWARVYSANSTKDNASIEYPSIQLTGNPYQGFLGINASKPEDSDYTAPAWAHYDTDRIPVYVNRFKEKTFPRPDALGSSSTWYQSSRPSSWHPGLVVMSFCDGNIRSISDSIDELVYVQMMTVSDTKSDAWNFTGTALFDPSWLD